MEMTFKFEFTEKEANILLNALTELPFKVSNELIQKIISSAKDQQELPKQE